MAALGIRGLLVADVVVLPLLGELRAADDLPLSLVLETSVLLPTADPATARELARLGADIVEEAGEEPPADLGVPEVGRAPA